MSCSAMKETFDLKNKRVCSKQGEDMMPALITNTQPKRGINFK